MNSEHYRGRTLPGLPVVIPPSSASTRMDKAIRRVEHYLKSGLDKETTRACVNYVAQTSGYSFQELCEKMRIEFVG
jgi:hypothetical protein